MTHPPEDCSWLQISTSKPGYAGDVVTLVARISRTECGRAILRKLRASGHMIMIGKPPTPTRPPNAWVHADATKPSAISIAFEPADWRHRTGRWAGDAVLLGLLGEAHAMTIGEESPGIVSATVDAYLRERTPSTAASSPCP